MISVTHAAAQLEQRGLLSRARHDNAELVIDYVRERIGRPLPFDLEEFYRERIASIDDFAAITPVWNDWVGWRPGSEGVFELLNVNAIPVFGDGCGNLYGLDLEATTRPAVYLFDHEDGFAQPAYAAGSSLGAFLLLLAEDDQAAREGRPSGWELAIDPDIDKCPRAPALWLAG